MTLTAVGGTLSTVGGTIAGLAAFTPDQISEQRLWLKASDLTLVDGDPVATWADKSPFAHTASQATAALRPTFKTAQVNGKPVVRFDGVDDYLQIPNHASLQPLSGPWTILFVGKRLGAGQGDFPQIIGSRPWSGVTDKGWALCYGGTAEVGELASHFADGSTGHDVAANATIQSVTLFSTSTFQAWELHENRSTMTWYLNGAQDATGNPQDPTSSINQTNTVYIGREVDGGNTRRANMDLAEVIIYGKSLTADERADLAAYFASEYGV